MVEFSRALRCLSSGIPQRYWDFRIDDIRSSFRKINTINLNLFRIWIDQISIAFEDGNGLFLWSEDYGSGKTAMAATAAKAAIRLRKRVRWYKGESLFPRFMGRAEEIIEVYRELDELDLVVIDELDKLHVVEERAGGGTRLSRSAVSGWFNELWDQKIVVVATANCKVKDLSKTFPESALSRIQSWVNLAFKGDEEPRTKPTLDRMVSAAEKESKNGV